MKCYQCGLESEIEQAFTKSSGLFGTRYYCPTCAEKRHRDEVLIYYVALPVLSGVLYAAKPGTFLSNFFVSISAVLLMNIPLIVLHEMAHAGVARLVNFRVFGVTIGMGRPFLKMEVAGFPWNFSPFPLGGVTLVGSPPVPFYRLKLWFIILAGPLLHFVLLAASYNWLVANNWRVWFDPLVYQAVLFFSLANLVILLSNLFPRRINTVAGMSGTDGWHLMRLPFMKPEEIQTRYVGYYVSAAMAAFEKNALQEAMAYIRQGLALHPDNPLALNVLGVIRVHTLDYAEARQLFVDLLARDNLEAPVKFAAMNNVAYCNVLLQDANLLPEADALSQAAHKQVPWHPSFAGTRGLVLARLGHMEEGLSMLKKSMNDHHEAYNKAINACHIALLEADCGNLAGARSYVDAARKLDPGCVLLPVVERSL